jgi:hypothetical protein
MRVIVRKPRGIPSETRPSAPSLAIGFFQKLEGDEHRIVSAIFYLMLHNDLPSLDVALVA